MRELIAGTEGGVRRGDGSFSLEGHAVTALAGVSSPRSLLLAATRDGAYVSPDGGATWTPAGLAGENLWTVAVREDADGLSVYAGAEPAALHRAHWDGGSLAWEELAGLRRAPGSAEWHSPWGPADLSSVAFLAGELYVGIEVGGVYRSLDRGETWQPLNDGLYEDVHTVVPTVAALYAATGGGFYRRVDGAWEEAGDGIARDYVMPVVVDPVDAAHLWTAGAKGPPPAWKRGAGAAVYESRDAARSWDALPPLPREVRGAIPRKGLVLSPDGLAAGTTDGYLLLLDGDAWRVLAQGLPPVDCVMVRA